MNKRAAPEAPSGADEGFGQWAPLNSLRFGYFGTAVPNRSPPAALALAFLAADTLLPSRQARL